MTTTTTTTASVPSEEGRVSDGGEPHRDTATFEELGVLGVDGMRTAVATDKARRVYHAPRRFEQPTETFVRKTGMRDRGPPGYEYNNTEHLSVSATVKPGAPG